MGKEDKFSLRDVPSVSLTEVHRERVHVLVCIAVLALASLAWAFFTNRKLVLDDLGLFNPPYMYANYGRVTYPVHGQFDRMTVHPPLHYWLLGVLMRAGIPPYYAEAVPPLFFLFLGLFLAGLFYMITSIAGPGAARKRKFIQEEEKRSQQYPLIVPRVGSPYSRPIS